MRVDLSTGEVINAMMPLHKFKITFEHSGVRDNLKMLEIAARVTEVSMEAVQHCLLCCRSRGATWHPRLSTQQ